MWEARSRQIWLFSDAVPIVTTPAGKRNVPDEK
ncbi:putative US2 [Roseibium sp. TrichSKD4]|nr:putative US2 [Roseibium sp. TrichSKD4]